MKALGRPSPDSDIFTWWKENGPQFPDLAILARIVHSVPATSVCSERLFSKAGIIYGNKLRNRFNFLYLIHYSTQYFFVLRLSGKMVEKILVIKANMDKIQLAPSGEPDPDDYDENEEPSDFEDVEDEII